MYSDSHPSASPAFTANSQGTSPVAPYQFCLSEVAQSPAGKGIADLVGCAGVMPQLSLPIGGNATGNQTGSFQPITSNSPADLFQALSLSAAPATSNLELMAAFLKASNGVNNTPRSELNYFTANPQVPSSSPSQLPSTFPFQQTQSLPIQQSPSLPFSSSQNSAPLLPNAYPQNNFLPNTLNSARTPRTNINSMLMSELSLALLRNSNAITKQTMNPKNARKIRQQEQFSAHKERTIYVSEIAHSVTEADIAALFSSCGDVVDCRMCGDAHSRMRFAFVEFSQDTWTFAVPQSLKLHNTILGGLPIRVQRSRTAIIPVKRELLPQNTNELIRCARTIYASNIDKRFTQSDIKAYFESIVADEGVGADGKVARVKTMADHSNNTTIAFVEFCTDESAACALNKCQGALMGCLPLRVTPSKTPIRTTEEERALREAQRSSRF